MRIIPLLRFLLIALLCLPGFEAIAQAERPAEPTWVPYRDRNLPSADEELALPRNVTARIGDPRLGHWAAKQSRSVNNLAKRELMAWLRVCELYRVTEAEAVVMVAVSRLDPATDDEFSRQLYATAAVVATAKSKDKLKKMIKALEEVPADIDERQRFRQVARLAAALVRLNDDAGRDFLLNYLKKGILTIGDSMEDELRAVTDELEWIGDDKLYKIIEALSKDDAFKEKKWVMENLLEEIDRNNKSVTTHWKTYDDEDTRGRERDELMVILAERDDTVAGLKKLAQAEPRHYERASDRTRERERERFNELRDGVVLSMQCRLWRELLKK